MIQVITDSVASIPAEMAKKKGIRVVSLFLRYNDQEFVESEMDLDEFYKDIYNMADNPPVSSQPSQVVMEQAFEEAAEAGDEVLGVFISSKMSGTFDNAVRAGRNVAKRHEGFQYAVIDSTTNCFDQAWPVMAGVAARDAGCDLKTCAQKVLESVYRSRFIFAPESLTFLQKGGRIGRAAALLGNIIKLSPILTVCDGEASTHSKVRSLKKASEKMAEIMMKDAQESGLRNVMVHYIGAAEPAIKWAREVIEPLVRHEVDVLPASPVIGTHVGPAMGLAYECGGVLEGKLVKDKPTLVVSPFWNNQDQESWSVPINFQVESLA